MLKAWKKHQNEIIDFFKKKIMVFFSMLKNIFIVSTWGLTLGGLTFLK